MSLVANVVNGKIEETTSTTESTSSTSKSNSTLDKDAFLQLLVAQMKYQDPLEPTSNTEYISQLATFSTLEEMQNMNATLTLQQASGYVGKYISLETETSSGDTKSITGVVDYVKYENNKAYLSVDGELYSADNVTEVYDEDYTNAYTLAYNFITEMGSLPSLNELTLDDQEKVAELRDIYDSMSSYQKSFISSAYVTKLENYESRISGLKEASEEDDSSDESNESVEETEETTETTQTSESEETDSSDNSAD